MNDVPEDRWKEVADRLHREKAELEREIERQRLLDELASSKSRNLELESALAKLARDQDRLALAERERTLKRAQIAQATAFMVHEANWAKTRMQNELKLTRERLQVFPEPLDYDRLSWRGVVSEPSRNATNTVADPKTASTPIVPQPSQTVPKTINSDPHIQAPSTLLTVPDVSLDTITDTAQSAANMVTDLGSTVADQVRDSMSNAAGNVTEATNMVSEAISSTYNGMFSAVLGAVKPLTETPAENPLPEPNQAEVAKPPSDKPVEPPQHPSYSSTPQESVKEPSKLPTASVTTIFPDRTLVVKPETKKVILKRNKGEWASLELHAQASSVSAKLVSERDNVFLKNPDLMHRLYGITVKPSVVTESDVPTPPEWVQIADEWARSVSTPPKPVAEKPKTKIDPVIASATGADPNLPPSKSVASTPPDVRSITSKAEASMQPAPPPPVVNDTSQEAGKKKKKNCVIM
jgi:chemotaxis protein CheY-P-specific phosphatase CheC